MTRTCTVPGCTRKRYARSLCSPHYRQERAGGAIAPLKRDRAMDALDIRMEILVSEALRDAIVEAAGEMGVSAGQWIRDAIRERLKQ